MQLIVISRNNRKWFEESFLNKPLTALNLVNMIHTVSSKTVIPEIHSLKNDYHAIKAELSSTKTDLVKEEQDIINLKAETKSLTDELNNVNETTNNNLKYLINHDRNVRRKNIMVFGVPDIVDMVWENEV